MRLLAVFAVGCLGLFGQTEKFNHVNWTASADSAASAPGGTVVVKLQADIDAGWHMYSLTTPPGPIPTTIKISDNPAVAEVTIFEPPPVRKFDPNFNVDTETYEGQQ